MMPHKKPKNQHRRIYLAPAIHRAIDVLVEFLTTQVIVSVLPQVRYTADTPTRLWTRIDWLHPFR